VRQDSTLLAALAHRALPAGAPIDLASICFDGGASPDRAAARDALDELSAFAPDRCAPPALLPVRFACTELRRASSAADPQCASKI
jgi:hypothetical protein